MARTTIRFLCPIAALTLFAAAAAAADNDPLETHTAAPTPDEAAAHLERLLNTHTSPIVDDYTYLRRVFFDIVGSPPTPERIRAFVNSETDSKRQAIVNELLDREQFGENWGRYWRDVIMYRRTEDRARLVAEAATQYLADALNAGQGWDTIAHSFITAKGDVREHGETAIIVAQAGRPEETVAEVSRIFLGVQIQCAQCHDHFTDSWTREQFHELAAYFPRTAIRPKRTADQRSFEVVSVDRQRRFRPKKVDRHLGEPEHYMPDLDDPQAKGTLMTPRFFLTDDEMPLGTRDMDRRQELANIITSNEWFAKSLVNRIWTDVVGAGFYDTVDDIGPERECRQPEALDYLASAFAAADCDLRWLLRTITRTKAYQAHSHSRPSDGEWSPKDNYPIRLRSDQLFNAVTQVVGAGQLPTEQRQQRLRRPRIAFAMNFGFDPSLPQDEVKSSVPQALMMMNSAIVDRMLKARRPGGIGATIQQISVDRELVEHLYLRCLSRPPTPSESSTALRHVKKSESRQTGFQDVVWSLLNCSEFTFR